MRATGDHAKMVELICAERDKLRAEVARLREALEQVVREWEDPDPDRKRDYGDVYGTAIEMADIARAALGRTMT